MNIEEEELIREICLKYNINEEYFKKLFLIEKEYANKNMGRRNGIFKDIKELLGFWTLKY